MRALLDATVIHAPGSAAETLILAVCLVGAWWSAGRLGGQRFALLLVGGQLTGFALVGHVAIPAAAAIAVTAASLRRRDTAPRAAAFATEAIVLGCGLVLYQFGRIAARSSEGPALDNAAAVVDFERRLGLFVEPDLQRAVTGSGPLMDLVNDFYSFGFLAFVAGALVFLFCSDRRNYVLLRNSLGISAAIAVCLIALLPTAPPRLLLEGGLTDTVVASGREHNFTNEFAAIPSLHVGWMALAGWALARSVGGRWRWPLTLVPGSLMGAVVIATGNHYWVDGVIGAAVSVGPALLLSADLRRGVAAATGALRARVTLAFSRGKTRFTALSLLGLLTYLVVGEIQAPGFTAFWGYLVFQMVGTLILLIGFEIAFAYQGGVSWTTHVVAVACGYLDVLGTAGDLYANIDEYDKLTHFMGVAAMTSGAYDVFRAMQRRGSLRWSAQEPLLAAISVGTAIGVGWEVYEFLGDRVFNSARVQGRWDTANDLVSDFLGAIAVAVVIAWFERGAPAEEPASQSVTQDNTA